MSSPDINYPAQPSYGEGLADALKAQVELLTGQGEFKEIAPGGLADLVPLESEVRQASVAQDTAALEASMLGAQQTTTGVTPTTQESQFEAYVDLNPDLKAYWEEGGPMTAVSVYRNKDIYGRPITERNKAAFGKHHWVNYGNQGQHFLPERGKTYDPASAKYVKGGMNILKEVTPGERQPGLIDLLGSTKPMKDGRKPGHDAQGNFLGLSELGEDLRSQAASAQRAGDIADVQANLASFKSIMAEVKPETTRNLDQASDIIKEQGERLTGDFKPISAVGTMQDPQNLRGTLQQQAAADLAAGRGLSDRQRREAEQAARTGWEQRGLIRDPSAVVGEVESVMEAAGTEEAKRRGFAQGVLGQEAGIQTAELSREMDRQRLNEILRQQGILGYLDAAAKMSTLEDTQQQHLDPFQAILGRPAGTTGFGMGQQMMGQGQYGLSSQPQYLKPEAGLGYISQMAANEANMYAAQQSAAATKQAGMFGGLGALGGGLATGFLS